jgi:ATP-binding protein involved in chromosome partitioning
MATKLIQQFLGGVEWGDLEYLIIDLPPGTGDVQLTLTQSTPLSGAIVVTTPQEVAVDVATRGIRMFEEVKVPILGIVENMSGFVCPHCHEKTDIFKMGGGREAARVLGIPFLGGVPIDPEAAVAGDRGEPVVAVEKHPRPASAIALDEVARALKNQIEHVQAQLDPMTTLNEVACDENGLILRWANRKTRLDFRKARLACPCAECVDENTGRVKLEEHLVPKDVRPFRFHPVGRYGLQIAWSDGHSTGIYTYRHLSELSN